MAGPIERKDEPCHMSGEKQDGHIGGLPQYT